MGASFDMAIEQAADAIMITDLGGVIRCVNRAFERATGYPRAEIVGRNARILQSGAHDPAFYRNLWETLTRGQAWRGAIVSRRKYGRLAEMDTVISPLRDGAGCVTGYLAVQRDVTQERRTALRQRRREEMTLVKALTGGVAHDLNNFLMTVVGLAEMLESRSSETRAVREEISELKAACDRATSFTRHLAALGQREVRRPDVIDLNEAVSRIEKILRGLLGKGVRVAVLRSAQPATVRFQPGQLEEVILHMALRARDAMPTGGTFTVAIGHRGSPSSGSRSSVRATDATGWIEVRVSDTGLGIDPEESAEGCVSAGSAGLCAWEATHIVERFTEKLRRHGGRILASGDPATGTTFALYLPHVAAEGARDREGIRTPENLAGSGTVLLAEDEDGVRELVRAGLTRLGYRVLDAPDGAAAMERAVFDGGPIDLLITDVVMPGMSGQELADRLVALHPAVRIVYMSGYPQEIVGDPRLTRRNTLFLQKPFTRERLAHAVREVFGRQ